MVDRNILHLARQTHFRRMRATAGRLALVMCASAALSGPVSASCNLIPQTQKTFRSSLGAADRPFATPGDLVELSVRPAVCDAASEGFPAAADDYVVTLVFTPPAGGPRRVVVLTGDSCATAANQAKLTSCQGTSGVASATCMQVSTAGTPIGMTIVTRNGERRLVFRFPDTDAVLAPGGDGRTLTGPVTIAVNRGNAAQFACGLATSSCASQSGLVACIDDLYALDGTCQPTHDPIFAHFTALPPPNNYLLDCFADAPCNPLATELRMGLDPDGNLLVPFNWQGIILRPGGVPVPRLLKGVLKSPLPFRIPSEAFVDSYTPEGGKLPPIFEPQFDPTIAGTDVVSLFGSADAPLTVLRIARHRGRCNGGTNNTLPCTVDTDCGGGTCVDACAGGGNNGLACSGSGDCPGGLCGSLYDASVLRTLTSGGGPLLLNRLNGSSNGICQKAPNGNCTSNGDCPGSGNPCVLYAFESQFPVPLEGLSGSEDIFSFVVNEAVDAQPRNGDGDFTDLVVTLRNRLTGNSQALGASSSCGIPGTPEGRAVLPIFEDPFSYPAVATENNILAFLEDELTNNSCDTNNNDSHTDALVRVFRLGSSELTAGLSPVRVADPAPIINRRALVVSNGFVFYRRAEAMQAQRVLETASITTGGVHSIGERPSVSADGRFVAFDSNADLAGEGNFAPDVFVRDRNTGTTEIVSVDSSGVPSTGGLSPSISGTGRYVAFSSGANLVNDDTNGTLDVFVRDRDLHTTERVSVITGGAQATGSSSAPAISADGQFVAFFSTSANLVSGDTNGVGDIFVHDRNTVTTTRVSVGTGNVQANAASGSVAISISGDGRLVAFQSQASNLVSEDTNGKNDIFVHDRQTGVTERVSVITGGAQFAVHANYPSISGDGRFVSWTTNDPFTYLHDRQTHVTQRVDLSTGGTQGATGAIGGAPLSTDGRFIGFISTATNLVPGLATSHQPLTYVHDRLSGRTELASVTAAGVPADGNGGPFYFPGEVALSADGRTIAFSDPSGNLGATNPPNTDVFVSSADPSDTAADIFPNGVLSDTVLEAFDTNTSTATTLCPAGQVVVANGKAAFLRPESTFGTVACPANSLNSDSDTSDEVVQLWPGTGAVQNLGLAATAVSMSATYIAALVPEAGENNSMLNAGSDTNDTVVHVHPVSGGSWTNIGQAADTVQMCGSLVVFITPESAEETQLTGLNGDGDQNDRVLQIYNPANSALINVGQAAEEFVCSSNLVAFRTSEAAQGPSNLNSGMGDTDMVDYVLQVYDIGRPECIASGAPANCLSNSHDTLRTCDLLACDPRLPYRPDVDTVKFIAYECDEGGAVTNGCAAGGTDLSGDVPPFAGNLVIRDYNVRTNTTRTIGRISGGSAGADGTATGTGNPLQDGQQRGPSNGVVYETVGRCIESLNTACMVDADCAAGAFCDSGTCQREQRVCVNDADCTGGVTCVQGANGTIIPASPDTDGDGVPDHLDNCPFIANAAQTDIDQDGAGDLCDGAICGNGQLDLGEECDGSIAPTCPGQCQPSCRCPDLRTRTFTPTRTITPTATRTPTPGPATATPTGSFDFDFDSVIYPHKAVSIVIAAGKTEVIKKFKVKVGNGDIVDPFDPIPAHTVRVEPDDGDCPTGTILSVDFDKKLPLDQRAVTLAPGTTKSVTVLARIDAATFPATFNSVAPRRCTLEFNVTTDDGGDDPSPENNLAVVELNVIDENDLGGTATHESVIKSAKPVKVVIPFDAQLPKKKKTTVKLVNADILPMPEVVGHAVSLSVDDNDCPPGTVTVLTPPLPVVVAGGANTAVKLQITADQDDFESLGPKSPARCTALITAVTAVMGNTEPDGTNNVTQLPIDVYDKNDFAF